MQVLQPTERCFMVTLAQPGLAFVPKVLKELEAARARCLAVYAAVLTEGTVSLGDEVVVSDPEAPRAAPQPSGASRSAR